MKQAAINRMWVRLRGGCDTNLRPKLPFGFGYLPQGLRILAIPCAYWHLINASVVKLWLLTLSHQGQFTFIMI